jgi:hypothetical protein
MAPPAPGRFSTMMGWPTFAATCSNTVRGKRSVALPGANGTTTVTRLVGHDCVGDDCGVCARSTLAAPIASKIASKQAAITANAPRRAMRTFLTRPPPAPANARESAPTGRLCASLTDRSAGHH